MKNNQIIYNERNRDILIDVNFTGGASSVNAGKIKIHGLSGT